jgi:uncharacterized protein DUF3368
MTPIQNPTDHPTSSDAAQSICPDPRWSAVPRGRKMAEQRGIFCLGLAGIALIAKRKGGLASVAGFLDDLEKDARFYLSAEMKREVLRKAGE